MRTKVSILALALGLAAASFPAHAETAAEHERHHQADAAAAEHERQQHAATPAVSPTPAVASAGDLQSVLEVMYADIERLKQKHAVSTNDVAAVGAGAGIGYLLGGLVTGGFVAPAVSSLATTVGFAQPTGVAMGTTIATMGTFAATYAGGVAGDALID